MKCTFSRAVDRHFEGAIGVRDEAALRAHLPDCDRCRGRYERWLVMSKLDPRALSAERRIASGLGIAPARRRWVMPVLATCAAIALCFVALRRDEEFQARGHATPRLLIYRVGSGLATDRIKATDELAFAFENPGARERLLVFGVDEHQHVVWYHPSWVDPTQHPVAVPITKGGELQEAIAHDLDGRTLTIYGVFTDRAVGVHEVERIVREGDLKTLGEVHATTLTVERP